MPKPEELPEGFKLTELGPLPEEWKVARLEEIAEVKYGKAKPKESGNVPVVGSGGIYSQTSQSLVDFPTLVIGRKGTAGMVWLLEQPFWPSDTTFYLAWKNANADYHFVYHYLQNHPLSGEHAKTTLPSLQKPDLENYLLPLPPLPEQRAIAHVLRTVQQAKEATERVIAATRELKKSLMRHLFTYGPVPVEQADKVPLKETEIGLVPEQWEVKPVGQLCKSIVPGRDKPKRFDGNIPWITMPDLRGKVYIETSISGLALSQDAIKEVRAKIIPQGSVIMSCVGEFGITAVVNRPVVINQQLHAFLCTENLDAYFLCHALKIQKSYMEKIAHFTTIAYLSKDKCESVPISLPSFSEQLDIARMLRTVDHKLESEENRKRALDTLFKTLLHHFMTGRVRVHDLHLPSL